MCGARGQDEIVEAQALSIVQHDCFAGCINCRHLGKQHAHVVLPPEDPTNGRSDIAWGQRRRGHLVQQWLKHVVIAAIYDCHRNGRATKGSRSVEPGESTANDHDLRERPSFVHADDEMILRFARRILGRNPRQPPAERSKLIE